MSAPYRHGEHVSTEPTRAQLIGRRIAGCAVAAALVALLGLVGAADVDTACQTADQSTSSVCR